MTHAATSKVENSAQGLSCKLKFAHAMAYQEHVFLIGEWEKKGERERRTRISIIYGKVCNEAYC
jgi:hypothetical protein